MKKISNSTKAVVLTTLLLTVVFIFCKRKIWNYKKVNSIEYNQGYNERHPITDTIEALYKNVNENNPIKFRKFNVQGHTVFGEANGGSRISLIHITLECDKCKKLLSLNSNE